MGSRRSPGQRCDRTLWDGSRSGRAGAAGSGFGCMAHPGCSGAGPIVRTTTAQSSHATFGTQGCVQRWCCRITLLKEEGCRLRLAACRLRLQMPGAARPWFSCPLCGRRCWHVYLLDPIALQALPPPRLRQPSSVPANARSPSRGASPSEARRAHPAIRTAPTAPPRPQEDLSRSAGGDDPRRGNEAGRASGQHQSRP
jgi:hypothetical protein